MTAETQRLSNDIKELIDERTQLSDQVQDYIAEVRHVEDVLSQKVNNPPNSCADLNPHKCKTPFLIPSMNHGKKHN